MVMTQKEKQMVAEIASTELSEEDIFAREPVEK
jgi:hypothetical protein